MTFLKRGRLKIFQVLTNRSINTITFLLLCCIMPTFLSGSTSASLFRADGCRSIKSPSGCRSGSATAHAGSHGDRALCRSPLSLARAATFIRANRSMLCWRQARTCDCGCDGCAGRGSRSYLSFSRPLERARSTCHQTVGRHSIRWWHGITSHGITSFFPCTTIKCTCAERRRRARVVQDVACLELHAVARAIAHVVRDVA